MIPSLRVELQQTPLSRSTRYSIRRSRHGSGFVLRDKEHNKQVFPQPMVSYSEAERACEILNRKDMNPDFLLPC